MTFFRHFLNKKNEEIRGVDALHYLCKKIGYEKYGPDEVIFEEGHPSNELMYMVLEGELSVVVKSLDFYSESNMNALRIKRNNDKLSKLAEKSS